MSLNNPYSPNFGWKIDPDGRQDRSPGPVTTRRMSPEEIKRYGIAEKVEVEDMNKLDIDEKVLLDICRLHGTGIEGTKEVAKKFNLTDKQATNQIYLRKIRRILHDEAAAKMLEKDQEEKMSEQDVSAINSHEEHPENIAPAGVHHKTKYYIATGYSHKERAEQLASVIKAAGGEVTCEWWTNIESRDPAELAEIGAEEFQGVRDCDMFVCMLPGHYGTHSELGAAVILGKKVILHSVDSHGFDGAVAPCYYQDNVKRLFGSELQLVAEILKGA